MIQFVALTDDTEPLEGEPTLSETTIQEYDPTSVHFDPIPFEYLKTTHEKAQLEVTVDSVKAVCDMPSDCDYMAIDTGDDVIDTVEWDISTLELSFDGSFFSTRTALEIEDEIKEIRFAGVSCIFDASLFENNTAISCTLDNAPQCGLYTPQVITFEHGPIFIDSAPISIDCVITDFSPKTFNPLGSEIVTITGEGFPYYLHGNEEFKVDFLSETNFECKIIDTSYTEIKCLTPPIPELTPVEPVRRRRLIDDEAVVLSEPEYRTLD